MTLDPESTAKPKRRRSNPDTWKGGERSSAEFVGGERIPVTGRKGRRKKGEVEEEVGTPPDIDHDVLAIEQKDGKQIPKLLTRAMSQAISAQTWYRHKGKGERIPVVFMHPFRARRDETLLIIRFCDLAAFLERFKLPESSDPESVTPNQ